MKILGLDPGLANFGYCLVKWYRRKYEVLDYGVWRDTDARKGMDYRLRRLAERITHMATSADVVAYELPNGFRGAKANRAVYGAVGTLHGVCGATGVTLRKLSVREIKDWAGGPAATKQAVALAVRTAGVILPDDAKDHVTDAAACAIIGTTKRSKS